MSGLPGCADTALPGLVQENLPLPITLADGSQVKLEAVVIRPDRPERFPPAVLVHGTPRASGAFPGVVGADKHYDFIIIKTQSLPVREGDGFECDRWTQRSSD
jgi:hypothetical protein